MQLTTIISAILATTLLNACSATSTQSKSSSGVILSSTGSSVSTVFSTASAVSSQEALSETEEEALEAAQYEYSPYEAMEESYLDALDVLDTASAAWEFLTPEEQLALEDVLDVFAADIETLGYYVSLSQEDQLTNEELEFVLNIMIDIEDAIELIATALETLL